MASQNLPTLQQGDDGEAVRLLEQLLASIFWFSTRPEGPRLINENVVFDAKFDQQCKRIVEEFQTSYSATFPPPAPNIAINGIVGPETWQALGDTIFRYTY